MFLFQGCDLHIHYRGISSKDVTRIHEQMGVGEDKAKYKQYFFKGQKESNKCISNHAQKEVTGVSEQQLNCENSVEFAKACPTHEETLKSFNWEKGQFRVV